MSIPCESKPIKGLFSRLPLVNPAKRKKIAKATCVRSFGALFAILDQLIHDGYHIIGINDFGDGHEQPIRIRAKLPEGDN